MTPWDNWEDWKAGLYLSEYTTEQVTCSLHLLTSPTEFREVAREMLQAWPNAADHNLRHLPSGHNSWIGQASCMYAHGAPSVATRIAWGMMTNAAQGAANRVAYRVLDEWGKSYAQETLGL